MHNSHIKIAGKTATGIGTLALVAVLAGCGVGNMASPSTQPQAGVTLGGTVHGGEQGVSGATIQLYSVGTTGYGSSGTPLISSTVTTDQYGSWKITGSYTCPTPSTLVYIMASGGNPGLTAGTNNTSIKLVAGLGACGNLTASTGIDINEVTTVAAAFALGQYFGAPFAFGQNSANTNGDSFGAPATTQAAVGITNAMATIPRLANFADGTAVTSQTLTGTPATTSITTTVDSAKIYTIANILSSCVNTDGTVSNVGTPTPCYTLFTSAAPNGVILSNTLEAAVFMSLNPTSDSQLVSGTSNSQTNLAALFALQTPTAPFAGLATKPNDWTLGIQYSAGASTTQTLINGANGIAIDAAGNIWIINLNSGATATESIAGFSPTGVPIANPFNSGATAPASLAATNPRNIAVDLNGNVIATASSSGGGLFVYSTSTAATSYLADGAQAYGIAIDASNNIFVTHNSATSNAFSFDDFLGGTLTTTSEDSFLFDSSTTLNQFAAISAAGNLYLSRGSGNASQILLAFARNTSTCTAGTQCTTATANYIPITSGTISNPYGMAAERLGGLWVADNGVNSVTYVTGSNGVSYGSAASFLTPRSVAVDGANEAWFTDRGGSAVSEITKDGYILSPVTTTNGATVSGAVGFVHSAMSSQAGIAIDPSGNVWVPSANITAGAPQQNSMYEMVGAAAPTVTPIALALSTSALGIRP